MQYRTLGSTGLKVSQLGFGAMRLPMTGDGDAKRVDREEAIPMIHKAFETGVNYIDSATFYCNEDSQRAVGDALAAWPKRDEIVVSTKNPYHDEDESEWRKNLENSLQRLQVDAIDVCHHHGISWKTYEENIEPRVGKWMQKAKDEGLVKHIAFSFHSSPDDLVKLIDTGYAESCTVQYNMLDRSLEEAIAHAHEKNMGVVVMGPVGGGRLGDDSDVLAGLVPGIERVPELALRFVLANPNVTVALSGMSEMQHVKENVRVASDDVALSDEDRQAIDKHLERLKEMAKLYCTGCKYCMPCEAADVNIPHIFSLLNRGKVYGLWESARGGYKQIGNVPWIKGNRADACTECGACEPKCPQNIAIREQLKEAHKVLKS